MPAWVHTLMKEIKTVYQWIKELEPAIAEQGGATTAASAQRTQTSPTLSS